MAVPTEAKIQQGRTASAVLRALFDRRHYKALYNIFLHHAAPFEFLRRYAFRSGSYPYSQQIRCNGKELNLCAYSWHDILTINEVFFRNDYAASGSEKVIVDFGSNIGLSAAFFLTAAASSFCYLFEPVATNVARLRKNLAGFEPRYELKAAAVALRDGEEQFGYEDTGRYGGIGVQTGSYVTVPCVDAIRVLQEIVDRHGSIDILKIDIEALEKEILAAIPQQLLHSIQKIFVEQSFPANPLAGTHDYIQYGSVAQFFPTRRFPAAPRGSEA